MPIDFRNLGGGSGGGGIGSLSPVEYFVDPIEGRDLVGRTGKSWGDAVQTIAAVQDKCGTEFEGIIRLGGNISNYHEVGNGISWAGFRCQPRGYGNMTIIRAATQTGPVFDFNGWVGPTIGNHLQIPRIGGFVLAGNGLADPTKVKGGFKCDNITNTRFQDILVVECGGTPYYLDAPQICIFENCIAARPFDAGVNSVPYWWMRGPAFGNQFLSCGLRSLTSAADGPAAWLVDEGGVFTGPSGYNKWDRCWSEFQHIPANGSFFDYTGNASYMRDWLFFDTSGSVQTNNQMFRFRPCTLGDLGANIYDGYIYGNGAGTLRGILDDQGRNFFKGTAGLLEHNIVMGATEIASLVLFGGQEGGSAGATRARVIDGSGTPYNMQIDGTQQLIRVGTNTAKWVGDGGAGSAVSFSKHLDVHALGTLIPAGNFQDPQGGATVTGTGVDQSCIVTIQVTGGALGTDCALALITFNTSFAAGAKVNITPVDEIPTVGGVAMEYYVIQTASNVIIRSGNGRDNTKTYKFNVWVS